ncbi:hypothetical protein JCM11641_005625 [Rhodosporidiobolus odoratus]
MTASTAAISASRLLSTLTGSATTPLSLVPPFSKASAEVKVKKAQDLWNTKDPAKAALAYTPDSVWRNRDDFFQGREAIERFLTSKWEKETQYKLRKRLFAFEGNRIAVQFWFVISSRNISLGTFDPEGLMQKRHCSANEVAVGEEERWFKEGVDVDLVEISERDG